MTLVRITLVVVVIAALARSAGADVPEGRIVFARGAELREHRPGGQETLLATLPVAITWMQANRSGSLVLVGNADSVYFWRDGRLHESACLPPARPSPGGHLIACLTAQGPALVATTRSLVRLLPPELGVPSFASAPGGLLAVSGAAGDPARVVTARMQSPQRDELVVAVKDVRDVTVAAAGHRAAAQRGQGDEQRVVVFSVEATGHPRILGGPARVVTWSPRGRWVGLQFGDDPRQGSPADDEGAGESEAAGEDDEVAEDDEDDGDDTADATPDGSRRGPRTSACAARARGGQMTCWQGHVLEGFSPDGTSVLLSRDGALFHAPIRGVKPPRPERIVPADGPSLWLPAPEKGPQA